MSSKVVKATYDAENNTLRLVEPLVGVGNDETLTVIVEEPARAPHSWDDLRGILSKEAGDELAAIIEEEFPIEK